VIDLVLRHRHHKGELFEWDEQQKQQVNELFAYE
jgi:hypothetical protein